MKVRNKNENVRYIDYLDVAIDQIQQAMDNITYTTYPEMNKRTIAKLAEIISLLSSAQGNAIFKP